ncbi:hypothetical protein T265_04664 [Opisthorchis viverrini]|uniref:Uncharacterized protein n=1 Tax=Opisthorchis viverrini TaxID=6198 RepID=A0A074ZMA8_OPIVI|nr:hypothetical protein T265_04664 [Opisthorchis viverrini]KER28528.1 hypothetical protein T265_04664 [Opisthorchis viverrini]
MSEELSFEQLSVSSNDSWALLDVEEPATATAPGSVDLFVIDRLDKDICFICNQPLSASRFPCPSCDICLICAQCMETYDPHRAPVCCHTFPTDAEVPMFYFDDSQGEDVLIMNPLKEVHPVSCVSEPDRLTTSTEVIQSSHATPDSNILDSKLHADTKDPLCLRDSDYRSLTDHVREALKLHTTEADIDDKSVVATAPENAVEVQTAVPGGPQMKLILSPKLWSQSDSLSSNLSSSSNSNNNGIPVPRISATPVLRTAIQVIRGSCNASECHTSSSSCSSRSPPSLSSSPLNVAGKILKSVALHSASAMNPFDCMPMDALDVNPVITKRTESRASPEYQPGTPPSSVVTGTDDRITNAKDFVSRFVWDNEKVQALIKPRPIPKSVLDQSAYNLR